MKKISLILSAISMMLLVACTKESWMQWEFIDFDMTGIQATANKSTYTYEIRVPKEGADFVFRPKKKSNMSYDISSCWQYNDSTHINTIGKEFGLSGEFFEAHIENVKNNMGETFRTLFVHIAPLNNDENVDENGNRKMRIGLWGIYERADLLFVQ